MLAEYRESPINYLGARLKDPEQDKKWLEENRKLLYERAKVYLAFMVFFSLVAPLFILHDLWLGLYLWSCFVATAAPLAICVWLASTGKLVVVDLIMPSTVLCRGAVSILFQKAYSLERVLDARELNCVSLPVDTAMRALTIGLTIQEIVLFWECFFTLLLFVIPTQAVVNYLA